MAVSNREALRLCWPEIRQHLEEIAQLPWLSKESRQALSDIGIHSSVCLNPSSVPKIGWTAFPAVERFGCIRWLYIQEKEPGTTVEPMISLLDRVGAVVCKTLRSKTGWFINWNPQTWRVSIEGPMGSDHLAITGRSMDLAMAIQLYGAMTGQNVPDDLIASAEVTRSGKIKPVGGWSEKLEAIQKEGWWIRRLYVANEQQFPVDVPSHINICRVSDLDTALRFVFPQSVHPSRIANTIDIDAAKQNIESLYIGYLLDAAIKQSTDLIHYLEDSPQRRTIARDQQISALFYGYWRRGCAWCHKGEIDRALKDLEHARRFYKQHSGLIPPEQYYRSRIQFAVMLKDMFQYQKAEILHREIAEELEQLRRLDYEKALNISSWSQMELARHRFEEAERLQQEAIRKMRIREIHRNYGYLIQIYMRWGNAQKAAGAYKTAVRHLSKLQPEEQRLNLQFLHYFWMEGLYRRAVQGTKRTAVRCHCEAETILSHYSEINHYAIALATAYGGFIDWIVDSVEAGAVKISRALSFLQDNDAPMFRLLAASIRSRRALHNLFTGNAADIKGDLVTVCEILSSTKHFQGHFREEIRELKKVLNGEFCSASRTPPIQDALQRIADKIPY
ncbi:MAG: S16 family serine protease [Thermodesulfobacteriota bacterium]